MENTAALNELTELIHSVKDLVELQTKTETRLVQMIEDSESRSVQRDNDLRETIQKLKSDIKPDIKLLKDEANGRQYHNKKMLGYWGIFGALVIGFIFWIANNFDDLRTTKVTHTLQIEQLFDKLGQVFDRLSNLENKN